MSHEEFKAFCIKYCLTSTTANYSICTERDFVDCGMYPKRIIKLEYLVPVTVALVVILLSGLLGNLSVCSVILKHPSMRNNMNLYLFSLAVSDILMLVFGLVPELRMYWQMYPYVFGDFVCRTTSFLASTATWASTLTVVALSIERYTAICHHTPSRMPGHRRIAMAIVAIWTISVAVAAPIFHVYHVVIDETLKYPPDMGKLSVLGQVCIKPNKAEYAYYDRLYLITSVGFFFMPMVILTMMYIKIGLFIRANRQLARRSGIKNNCAENTKIFKVLVAVVLAFFFCSAPYHYQRVSAHKKSQEENRTVLVITSLFYYFSATINPILYNAMSKRYRTAFKELISFGAEKKNQNLEMNAIANVKTASIKSATTTTANTDFTLSVSSNTKPMAD